jgi:2-phosphosulfolactate phosphatase
MNIRILQLLEGARAARGVTVIIDVFRAFSLESYMFASGVERIYPIGSADTAYKMKKNNPDWILAGERGGAILPGFDTGNAPSELYKLELYGKTVVHTTSAGTQGVANATEATTLLGGALVNARATAEYIRRTGADEVSLVCMGWEAREETDEDTLCARYIKALLEGNENEIDMHTEIENLKVTSGAKFFDEKQNHVFPRADFFMCTEVDKFDFVLRYDKESGEMCKESIL